MPHAIGIDVGTTNVKVAMVGSDGAVVAAAARSLTTRRGEGVAEEGARISAAVKPRQPEDVARVVVRGIDRHKFVITADPQTAVVARIAGLLALVLHRMVDRTVLDVQDERARQS